MRSDLYFEVVQSQQYQDERLRMNSLSHVLTKVPFLSSQFVKLMLLSGCMLWLDYAGGHEWCSSILTFSDYYTTHVFTDCLLHLQNDVHRLRILLPLLELLHHHCINQHSIQHAAACIGEKFASCLLRPPLHCGTAGESEAPAVSACIAMVLDYRSLFGQSAVDVDSEGEKHSAALATVTIPQGTSTAQIPKACHMPSSPMAARRLPRAHFLLRSEPEDFECAKSAPCSPTSDDMDSAFSASSIETDDNKVCAQAAALDDDLVQAVDNLFLESTSDLLFTSDSLCLGRASGQSNRQSYPDSAEELFSSIAHRELQPIHARYIHSCN